MGPDLNKGADFGARRLSDSLPCRTAGLRVWHRALGSEPSRRPPPYFPKTPFSHPPADHIYICIYFPIQNTQLKRPLREEALPGPGALPALPRSGAAAPGAPAAPAAPGPRRRALNFPGAEAALALQCLAVNKRQAVTTQPSCSQSGGCLCTFPLQHTPSAF